MMMRLDLMMSLRYPRDDGLKASFHNIQRKSATARDIMKDIQPRGTPMAERPEDIKRTNKKNTKVLNPIMLVKDIIPLMKLLMLVMRALISSRVEDIPDGIKKDPGFAA